MANGKSPQADRSLATVPRHSGKSRCGRLRGERTSYDIDTVGPTAADELTSLCKGSHLLGHPQSMKLSGRVRAASTGTVIPDRREAPPNGKVHRAYSVNV